MLKTLSVILALATTVFSAEISSSYASLEKHATFQPEMKSEPVETHTLLNQPDTAHPIYRAEVAQNQGRARIEPVRPLGQIIKHESMLSDQPAGSSDVNRVDELGIMRNGYLSGPAEVAYPDIAYAPAYLYGAEYPTSNNNDMYGEASNSYLMEPDTSVFSLLWSQVRDGRTLVSYMGRTIIWIFNSVFVILLGSLLTIGVCSYTNLCSITFNGVEPINKNMRALITPERLENISNAADFVKTAIDKYQKIQKVTDEIPNMRRRRAIFNY